MGNELMLRGVTIALLTAICSTSAVAQQRHGAIVLPVSSCISSPFGPRILPNFPQAGTFHNGVDLPAPEGTPVRAVASGKLLRINHGGPGGLEVLIQHDGFVTVYSHLAMTSPSLGKAMITAGEEVGIVGHTGVSIGAHLFFGLLQAGRAVDPAPFLGAPLCNGVARQQTPAQILDAGGKLPPTRHYLSDFPASRS